MYICSYLGKFYSTAHIYIYIYICIYINAYVQMHMYNAIYIGISENCFSLVISYFVIFNDLFPNLSHKMISLVYIVALNYNKFNFCKFFNTDELQFIKFE